MVFTLGLKKCCSVSLFFSRPLSLSIGSGKGHSHWQNIKDIKQKNDIEKSQKINKFLVKMKVAVKEAGGMDPKYNSKLAKLQAEYQKAGLPMDTFRKKLSQLKDAAV